MITLDPILFFRDFYSKYRNLKRTDATTKVYILEKGYGTGYFVRV